MALDLEAGLAENDLLDSHVEQLLRQAEVRLQEHANSRAQKHRHVLPAPSRSYLPTPYVQTRNQVASLDGKRLLSHEERKLGTGVKKVEDPLVTKKRILEEKKATAGSDWFNLPRTDVTPELKRELQILRMRDVLDPKRHYKKESSRAIIPEYSQVGTLIEGPTEFYSARIPNSQRKRSLVEEILEGERGSARFKTKYKEVQAKKMSGKRGHYRRLMEKRYRKKLKR